MSSKRNTVLKSDSENEETEADKQWNYNIQSWPCAPLIHRITGGGRVLQPHTTPRRRKAPSTS